MLAALGLDEHAEAAYRVALGQVSWPTTQLVEAVGRLGGVPAERVGAVIADLESLGLVRPSYEQAGTWLRVVAPVVALEGRLLAGRSELIDRQQVLERAASELHELQESYAGARDALVEHSVERLTGLDAVRGRLEQLAREARQEALSFMPGGAHSPESLEASAPLDRAALERGVNLRNLYLHSALNDPATSAYLRRLDEIGGETRTVATLPMRMLVVDRSLAMIPIDPQQPRQGALVVRSPGILAALLALFESVWSGARLLGERKRIEDDDLSDTDREILRILALGATDEGVARQLGVSVRTVRRLTSLLMTRLQARSRFELGLRLGHRGWDA